MTSVTFTKGCELKVCPGQITQDALHLKSLDPFIDELDLPQVHMVQN